MNEVGQESSMRAAVAPVPSVEAGPSPATAAGLGPAHVAGCHSVGLDRHLRLHPRPRQRLRVWDDDENFVDNPYFRGLGAAQVSGPGVRACSVFTSRSRGCSSRRNMCSGNSTHEGIT